METRNKIALVTGGSRGIGRNAAINIAKKGLDVIITYHSKEQEAKNVVAEIESIGRKAAYFQADTSKIDTFDAFFKQVTEYLNKETGSSNFDYLVNNAGTALHASIAQTTEKQFDTVMNIHLKGVYFFTQKALPFINDGGGIVNISTGLTRFSVPGSSAYASMKGAIEVFTRYLAKEYGSRQIRANVVAPGAIATDFGGGHTRDDKETNKLIADMTAMGRAGLPDDLGGVVAFLCTDDARWITAQRIEVSGGMVL